MLDKINNKLDKEAKTASQQQRMEMAAEIFEQFGGFIFSVIRYYTTDESMAEDIFQDFFVSLIRKPIPADLEHIKSYIWRALRNDIMDVVKKEKFYHDRISRYQEIRTNNKMEEPSREDFALRYEEAQEIVELIKSNLPPHQAQAVFERYYYSKNNKEVSEVMNVDRKTVSHYVCNGLNKIRNMILNNP